MFQHGQTSLISAKIALLDGLCGKAHCHDMYSGSLAKDFSPFRRIRYRKRSKPVKS
jgi:hypothetical protein